MPLRRRFALLRCNKHGGDSQLGSSSVKALQDLTSSFGLSDIFRSIHPSNKLFTWTNGRVSCRLDRFYVSKDIAECTSKTPITLFPFSDHDAPSIVFKPPLTEKRGRGYWKFNTTLLQSEEFTDKMKNFLEFWITKKNMYENKLDVWWDIGKKKIKHICLKFSKKFAKEKRKKRLEIENQIHALTLSRSPTSEDEISILREKIKEIDTKEIQGARIRAKELHYFENEKPSRYFYNLENRRQTKKVIASLKDENGGLITGRDKVLDYIASFYQRLYTEEEIDPVCQDFLVESIERTLSTDEQETLEGPLETGECLLALQSMKRDKSPGSDGLPAEFYTFFWDTIGDSFVEVLNFCFGKGLLTESMRLAIISLLYKKNDRQDLKNWRPISLLNVDYKIGTKALTMRLKKVLHLVLSNDQTCSVPNRSIFENLFLFRDVFAYTSMRNIPLALVKIDQEKAFDRVNWNFLDRVLLRMNFGPSFRSLIRTLYNGVSSKILNNGHFSKPVLLRRGVRQGCPISPLLYCLVAETLGNAIRQCNKIRGLKIPRYPNEVKISQYADDTTLFLKDESSIIEADKVISKYESGSGSKVNYNIGKSEAMWLGPPNQGRINPLPKLNWVQNGLEILGLNFGSPQAVTENWNSRLRKLQNRLDAWSHRTLSLRGKVLIINSLALSGLIYIGTVYSVPESILKLINRAIFTFLWSNKNELVSRKSVFQPIEKGGLGITDFKVKSKALHLKFLKDIVDVDQKSPWIALCRYFIGQHLPKYSPKAKFLRSNLLPYALTCPPHYDRFLSMLVEFKDSFELLSDVNTSVKRIYEHLLESNFVRPLPELIWDMRLERELNWKQAWLNTRLGLSTGLENDVLWKVYHRVLKTASYVKSWGLKVNENCDICPVTEDINHVFISCKTARNVWRHFSGLINSIVGSFELTENFVFFLKFPTCKKEARSLANYIVKLIIYHLWIARCERRFEGKRSFSNSVIFSVKTEIKTRIKTVYNSITVRKKQLSLWSFRNILCSIENGSLVINLK